MNASARTLALGRRALVFVVIITAAVAADGEGSGGRSDRGRGDRGRGGSGSRVEDSDVPPGVSDREGYRRDVERAKAERDAQLREAAADQQDILRQYKEILEAIRARYLATGRAEIRRLMDEEASRHRSATDRINRERETAQTSGKRGAAETAKRALRREDARHRDAMQSLEKRMREVESGRAGPGGGGGKGGGGGGNGAGGSGGRGGRRR